MAEPQRTFCTVFLFNTKQDVKTRSTPSRMEHVVHGVRRCADVASWGAKPGVTQGGGGPCRRRPLTPRLGPAPRERWRLLQKYLADEGSYCPAPGHLHLLCYVVWLQHVHARTHVHTLAGRTHKDTETWRETRANLFVFKHSVYFYSLQLLLLHVWKQSGDERGRERERERDKERKREREIMSADLDVSEPGGQTAGISMKGPIEAGSDQAAWTIGSKWILHFSFIFQKVTLQKSSFGERPASPRGPLRSVLLFQWVSGDIRNEAGIVFATLALLFSLIRSGKCCVNNLSLQVKLLWACLK